MNPDKLFDYLEGKLSPSEREGLKVFQELRKENEFIDEDDWYEACEKSGSVSSAETPDNRQRSVARILVHLIRKKRIKKTETDQLVLHDDIDVDQYLNPISDQPDQTGPNPDRPDDNESDGPDHTL